MMELNIELIVDKLKDSDVRQNQLFSKAKKTIDQMIPTLNNQIRDLNMEIQEYNLYDMNHQIVETVKFTEYIEHILNNLYKKCGSINQWQQMYGLDNTQFMILDLKSQFDMNSRLWK